MKKWMRFAGALLACCMMINLVPANLLAADMAAREEKLEDGAGKGTLGGGEANIQEDCVIPPSMTEVTPIYEEDEAEQETDAPQESEELQELLDGQTRSVEGVYQKDLKIWFDADSGTVTDAEEDIETLDLPQTIGGAEVKAIGKSAFSGCKDLLQITLPKSLGSIGDLAFSNCKALTSIAIPKGVTEIPWYAFSGCASLSEAVLPEGLVKIWDGAFENCRSLTSIAIPDGTKQIGLTHDNYDQTTGDGGYYYCGVFSDCVNLKEVSFGSGLSVLGNDAFKGCAALEAVQLPEGVRTVGGDAFANCTSLSSVKLPGSLEAISLRMFSGCKSLTEIEIPYGVTEIQVYAFSGCTELSSVVIPESVTTLGLGYDYRGWDFTVHYCGSVFQNCPKLTYITIPESVTAITDEDDPPHAIGSGYSVQHGVNFDDTTTLRVKEGSRAEQYAVSHGLNYMYYFDEKALTLDLRAPDGTPVTDGYSAVWYARGSDVPLANGATLFAADSQKEYDVEIKLSDRLLETCLQPGRQAAEFQRTGSGYLMKCVLEAREQTAVSGRVTDESGEPVAGAVVVFEQTFEKHKKSSSATTDGSGNYTASLFRVPTQASCHADGYGLREGIAVSLDKASCAVETITMKQLSSERIRLDAEKISAAKDGERGKAERVASFGGIEFSLYNQTKKREITSFEAQYPYLYLEEGQAGAGDQIRITANDTSGSFAAAEETAVFSDRMEASAALTFLSRGSFTVAVDRRTTGYLFDRGGSFVSSCTGSAALSGDPLAAGTYSLILLKDAPFPSLSARSVLDDLGLEAGKDYLIKDVTITDGKVTDLGTARIPDFQASAFQNMVSGSTSCTVKKSEVPVGSLLAVRMEYALQKDCPSSDETAVLDLPEGLSVIPGSLTVDGAQKNYLAQGGRVTVNVGKRAAVLRFYVSASDAGSYALNTYLRFQTGAKTMLHPVGTAEFTATELALSASSETGLKTAVVSGNALPKSEVWVYDNNVRIASATANAAGFWSARFDLVEPGSYSKHDIYAEVVSAYGVKYRTASHRLVYDESFRDLKRITMAHRMSTVVVDYQEANSGTLTYEYAPNLPFSFKVEFTGGGEHARSGAMENVQVAVSADNSDVIDVDCIYDRENDCYIGTYSGESAVVGFAAIYEQPSEKSVRTFVGEGGKNEGENHAYTPETKGSAYRAPSESMTFGLNDSYPKKAANGTVTLFLDGRLFEPDIEVSLSNGEKEYAAQKIYWVNHQRVYATFDLSGAPDGAYSVTATCNGASDTLSDCLAVDASLPAGTGSLSINFSESAKVGAEYEGSITVKNTGYTDLYAPVLMLSAENLQLKLDKDDAYVEEGEVFVQNREGLSGIIAPGETAGVNLIYRAKAAGKFTLKADDYSKKRGNLYEKKTLKTDSEISDILTANVLSLVGAGYREYTKSMADMASAVGLEYPGVITVELLESMYEQNARGDLGSSDGFSVVDVSVGGLAARRTFSNSLHRKQICGAYGYGWNADFELKAEYISKDGAECIAVSDADSMMIFAKDDKKGNFVEIFAGEDTALRRGDGSIVIQKKNGLRYTFGTDGRQESAADVYGNTVTYTYEDGKLVSAASSDGDTLSYAYRNGRIVSVASEVTGDQAEYRYDGDYLESVTTKFGTTTYRYDKSSVGGRRGTLTGIDYADGTSVSYTYDDLGRLVGAADATGTVTYAYGLGEVAVSDGEGHTVRQHYDLLGNVLWSMDAYGDVCYYEYDGYGCQTRESFGLFDASEYRYTKDGEMESLRAADGTETKYTYDSHGGIASVTDALGHTVRYDEDANGRLSASVYPDGSKESYTYDAKGNIATAKSSGGVTGTYRYDERNNLVRADFSTGNWITYTYNEKDYLTGINEDGKITAIVYDEKGLPVKITYPDAKTVSYGYDDLGRRTSVTDSEGNVTRYAYNALGRLESVYDGETEAISYTYNKDGALAKQQNANGTSTAYAYHNGRISEICNYGTGESVLSRFAFTYDKYGYIHSMETNEGAWNYEYDRAGQMTKAAAPDGSVTEYAYDAAGNRVSVKENGKTAEYTANSMNQYQTAGGVTRSYDANGNLAAEVSDSGAASYEWDYRGRLAKMTTADGHVYEYGYDAFGGRNRVSVDGVSTEYVNDPTGVGFALTAYADGDVSRYLISGGVAAVDAGSGLCFYSFNQLGSTVGITSPDGTLANRYLYDAEGRTAEKSETMTNPYAYAGAYGLADDGNGLWYDRARYVSQATGSFISMDPAGQSYDLNMYRFVGNNPVNFVDVSGEDKLDILNDWMKFYDAAIEGKKLPDAPKAQKYIFHIDGDTKGFKNGLNHLLESDKLQKTGNAAGNGLKSAAAKTNSKMLSSGIAKGAGKVGIGIVLRVVGRIAVKRLVFLGIAMIIGTTVTGGTALAVEIPMAVSTVMDVKNEVGNALLEYQKLSGEEYSDSSSVALTTSKTINMSYSMDPSGYVYEGVVSNRLPGVKAVIYYEDYPLDEFGQPNEEAGLCPIEWTQAEDYGETNPQYTDANGAYGWDVPPGRWKVKFSKEGYEDYETDWMEVPPEYTDVNINLKNLADPALETLNVYSDCVQMIFSQYMEADSVTADAVTVEMDGRLVKGTVEPVYAESDYGETGQYAQIFEFYPDGTLFGDVTVSVSGVKSYCKTEMADVQRTQGVSVKPERVTADCEARIGYGAATPLSIDVAPGEAGKFKGVEILAKTPAIADVDRHKISLDENGHGEVSLTGNMPGTSVFEIRVKGTALRCTAEVTVAEPDGGASSKVDLSACDAALEYESAVYAKRALEPAVTVTHRGQTLANGRDYSVIYRDNVNAGTAAVILKGQGDYTGTKELRFVIRKAKNMIHLQKSSYSCDASPDKKQEIPLYASADGGTLSFASNHLSVAAGANGTAVIAKNFAGTATIAITAGDQNYETVSASVKITVNRIENKITASNATKTVSKKMQKFSLKAKCESKGNLTYRSNHKSVKVDKKGKVTIAKNFIGQAKITIKAKATGIYRESLKTVTVTVNPTGTKVLGLKCASGRKMTVEWKKNASVDGYQIQYADNKEFKKAATKKIAKKSKTQMTFGKLKAESACYVRIRTFKKVSKKTRYSSWSKVKALKLSKS